MLLLLVGVPVTLSALGYWPAYHRHPWMVLEHSGIMDGMWSMAAICSMVWSVIGVRGYNNRLKAGK